MLFIPTPKHQASLSFHLSAGISAFNLVLFLPGLILFLTALKSFKQRLRIAYGFISSGLILFSLGTIQYPILAILRATNSAWATKGYTEMAFVVGAFCVFMGTWLYARLIGIKGLLMSWPVVLVIVFVLMGAVSLLPHNHVGIPENGARILLALHTWEAALFFGGAVLALLIKRKTTFIYTRAMAWIFVGFSLYTVGVCFINIVLVIAGFNSWYFTYNVFLLPFSLGALTWLKAAEAFHDIATANIPLLGAEGGRTFFGQPINAPASRQASCVDVVVFLASLSSDPSRIDQSLDELRRVTARQTYGQVLGRFDQERLAETCLQIETYLTENEPVRKLSRSQLRRLVSDRYRNIVNDPYFWQRLDAAL